MFRRPARVLVDLGWAMSLLVALSGSMRPGDPRQVAFDDFESESIGSGWVWLREAPGDWHLADGKLRIRTNGSLWGPENTQLNILLRSEPLATSGDAAQPVLTVEVTVASDLKFGRAYEHGGLIWYWDDDNWVTLTLLHHVQDETQKILLVHETEGDGRHQESKAARFNRRQVDLRLTVAGSLFTGSYRAAAGEEWIRLGSIRFPQPRETPRVGLVAGEGPDEPRRWASFDDFRLSVSDSARP